MVQARFHVTLPRSLAPVCPKVGKGSYPLGPGPDRSLPRPVVVADVGLGLDHVDWVLPLDSRKLFPTTVLSADPRR